MPEYRENWIRIILTIFTLPPYWRNGIKGGDDYIKICEKANRISFGAVIHINFEFVWLKMSGATRVSTDWTCRPIKQCFIGGSMDITYKWSWFCHDWMTRPSLAKVAMSIFETAGLRAGGTISSVVLMATPWAGWEASGDWRLLGSWFPAIRQIMLRVLPRPISSASSPPWKCGGAWAWHVPLTLFL